MGLIAVIGGTGVCDVKMMEHVTSGQMDNYYGTIHYAKGTYKGKMSSSWPVTAGLILFRLILSIIGPISWD